MFRIKVIIGPSGTKKSSGTTIIRLSFGILDGFRNAPADSGEVA